MLIAQPVASEHIYWKQAISVVVPNRRAMLLNVSATMVFKTLPILEQASDFFNLLLGGV
jgi:hypothetical protein